MRNPTFNALLDEIRALHERKNSDYAEDGNPYSNFEEAAATAAGFSGGDAVFATMIGIKLARLRQLLGCGKTPQNESVDDSLQDLTTYAALWTAWRRDNGLPRTGRVVFERYATLVTDVGGGDEAA